MTHPKIFLQHGDTQSQNRLGRNALTLLGLLTILVLLVLANLLFGARTLPLTMLGKLWQPAANDHLSLVLQARLPRLLCGMLAGMALAMAGCVIQALCRNPLADPGLLGVNAGASASLVTLGLWSATAGLSLFWQALPGALLASALVYMMSRAQQSQGQSAAVRLILAGAAISAVLGAYVQARVLLNPQLFDGFRYWMAGSLSGLGWPEFHALWPYLLPAAALLWLLAPALNLMLLDNHTAKALGASQGWQGLLAWLGATLLCAAATAIVGPLAFVGLASAHLARRYLTLNFRLLLPGAALIGGAMVLLADLLARVLMPPAELLTGIMVALLGAPFLYLMARGQNLKEAS
ncbi:FecCD family ABC transporter permease [Shewanella algae]|uniref:FecCD family ABC transporter permease n=1 Tax=Shewanella algae TaxID=38313 RepID=UPI00118228F6|nr:iron ABC transporter permease [Shewanella algae]MBO2552022.1 iron ABC transporter permease [Shewanella algae]MCE9773817.1 iron ABC transporter permease [Shewanella algae]TVL15476.1 iron-siderophore ABC transporter permease [Shewanella algae]BCV57710.1 iron ABC transporter permease [Shewanella algae]